MTTPRIGMPLEYFGKLYKADDQPQLAFIVFVHNDRCVNIALFDAHGNAVSNPPQEVFLLQDGDVAPTKTVYCRFPEMAKPEVAAEPEKAPEPKVEFKSEVAAQSETKPEPETESEAEKHPKPKPHAHSHAGHKKH